MGSNHGNFERLGPSAPKKMKSLIVFEDLLDNLDMKKLHCRANLEEHGEKDSSPSDYQSGVRGEHSQGAQILAFYWFQ